MQARRLSTNHQAEYSIQLGGTVLEVVEKDTRSQDFGTGSLMIGGSIEVGVS